MKIIKDGDFFDIVVDGVVVGVGTMNDDGDGMPYLERMDINEDHRNKGYGTEALYLLEEMFGSFVMAPDNADCQRWMERVAEEHLGDYWAVDQGFGVYEF